ncbi:DUF742 domain-containing protein [Nonomuraea sp. NPDC049400]|uniref:DUF742 domain-containing protein n=1 Tax=Nonomuraea sp. NPDC049400 TaxID=3364352 RepID=UPI003798C9B5
MTDPRWGGGWRPPPDPDEQDQDSPVRPYAVTGGRTAPRIKLAMEALVCSADAPPHAFALITPEYAAISELCRQVRSVAEVAAVLEIPLGVARVLIADMAAEGLLQLHHPQLPGGRPDPRLLERVLSGLQRL